MSYRISALGLAALGACCGLSLARGQANYTTPYTFTTIAGNAGYGIADGVGSVARFNLPQGIAADLAGNLFVSDAQNSTVRRMTPVVSGGQTNWLVTTIAGLPGSPGSADGPGNTARFYDPHGLAVDRAGNVFVADFGNQTVREISPVVSGGQTNWVVATIAGLAGAQGIADGSGNTARFHNPSGVASDGTNNLFVADDGNGTIRKLALTVSGGQTNWVVSTIAGLAGNFGSADGTSTNARFYNPFYLALDATGNLYVADYGSCTIRQLTPPSSPGQTNWSVSTIAGLVGSFGSNDGTGTNAQFLNPFGIAVAKSGTLYVADSGNNTIRSVTPKLTSGITQWTVGTIAGSAVNSGSADGSGSGALFNYPNGLAVDGAGTLYVTDTFNDTIRDVTPSGMPGQTVWTTTTIAGLAGGNGSGDGTGSAAQFDSPDGVALDQSGNLYVTDFDDCTVRRISPTLAAGQTHWVVTTIAGSVDNYGSADGTGAGAQFDSPDSIAVDTLGRLYVADTANETIRLITPLGTGANVQWKVTTIAGSVGIVGSADGIASQAEFAGLGGMILDSAGNLFVADSGNYTVRKVSPVVSGGQTNWQVSTIAGLAGSTGTNDGIGAAARFSSPYGITQDPAGNLFVTDGDNHTIREITPSISAGTTNWVVTTIAGSAGTSGALDGIGTGALFNTPAGIAADAAGNLFVTEASQNTVRKLIRRISGGQTNWVVSTLGGLSGTHGSADGTGSASSFNSPWGVAVDRSGNLYVTDWFNYTIRQGISPPVMELNPPTLTGPEVQINFGLAAGWAHSFELLGAPTVNGPWTTNTSANLATNGPAVSFKFTAPVGQTPAQFYRVQCP